MLQYYTSYDQIRAVVALSPEELPDEVLSQPLYESELYELMSEFGDTFTTRYQEVRATVTQTRDQERFIRLTGLWATYAVSIQLLGTLMMAPQSIEDGRAKMERFNFDKDTLVGIQTSYNATKTKLIALFNKLYPAEAIAVSTYTFSLSLSSAVGIATDPVVS